MENQNLESNFKKEIQNKHFLKAEDIFYEIIEDLGDDKAKKILGSIENELKPHEIERFKRCLPKTIEETKTEFINGFKNMMGKYGRKNTEAMFEIGKDLLKDPEIEDLIVKFKPFLKVLIPVIKPLWKEMTSIWKDLP